MGHNIPSTMHAKSDSELTCSVNGGELSSTFSTPPRSPTRRPLYYVQSPSHSYNSSPPFNSPSHNHHFLQYHCSPIHHSRESSTSNRLFSSGSFEKNSNNKIVRSFSNGWRKMKKYDEVGSCGKEEEEGEEEEVEENGDVMRFYFVCFLLGFVLLFSVFSLIIWAASSAYKPKIDVKSITFENFNVQAGMDATGVPTDMLTLKSTVKIFYRNPATFFGVHVTSTPLQLHFFDLKVASGYMKKFYESRKSEETVIAVVEGHQVPLYGGIPVLSAFANNKGGRGGGAGRLDYDDHAVPLNLTFVIRSRAYILGRLVNTIFYRDVLCQVTFRGNHLGKPHNLTKSRSCVYR